MRLRYLAIFMCMMMIISLFAGCGKEENETSSKIVDLIDEHYGVHSIDSTTPYTCKNIKGETISGFKVIIKADMKEPLTPEQLLNDAYQFEKNSGAIFAEIYFFYRLDESYNTSIKLCHGEIVGDNTQGQNTFITPEEWLANQKKG